MHDKNEQEHKQYSSVHIHKNNMIKLTITSAKDLASVNHTC